jgi:hypothetical protein
MESDGGQKNENGFGEQDMGEIKQGDALSLALAFWGAIQGIAEARLWFPDAPIPDSQCIVDLLKAHRQ